MTALIYELLAAAMLAISVGLQWTLAGFAVISD